MKSTYKESRGLCFHLAIFAKHLVKGDKSEMLPMLILEKLELHIRQ